MLSVSRIGRGKTTASSYAGKSRFFSEVYALFIAAFFCFGYLFNMYVLASLLLAYGLLYSCVNRRRTPLSPKHIYVFCLLSVWLASTLYSAQFELAFKYLLFCLVVFVISLLMDGRILEVSFKYMIVFCGIHVLFVILQYFSFGFVDLINRAILTEAYYAVAHNLNVHSGAMTGITGQSGQAALYCVVFIALIAAYSKKNKLLLVFLLPGFIALLLTQKRSFLLISALLCLASLFSSMKKKSFANKVLLAVAILVGLAIGLFAVTQYFEASLSKMLLKIEGSGLSNRDVLWLNMINLFETSPLFGVGFYSTDYLLGMTGHNIYLQLLCENGLIGALPFYVGMLWLLFEIVRYKNDKPLGTFLRFNILFVLIYGMLGNPIYEFTHMIIIMISISSFISLRERGSRSI